MRKDDPADNSCDAAADEALPRLLWGDLDKGRPAEKEPAKVGHDVVADDEDDGQDEPEETLKDVENGKLALADDEEEGHVGDAKLVKLEAIVALLQVEDKGNEACDV